VLSRLSDVDCSADGFKYLDARQASVAGVPALLLRIGFVGELGYEIHFPASYGEHVWDAILSAGADQGLRPFGLEPQRVLRLEKQHIIVGQDTDSESDPFASAMPWIVKLDKPEDFVGRWALEHAAARSDGLRLVGFRARNGDTPAEGAAVVVDGHPAGRVTSSRRSERVGAAIGLAWVPADLARDGAELSLRDNGREIAADVVTAPFYDPDGERLRS
jgi:sarcosine oxidase subunit alpha